MMLVIGYGSTLRSDDGVGQHVANEVAAQGWPAVRGIARTQLMPELAAELAEAELVIFVDAIVSSASGVQAEDITIAPDAQPGPMTHHATPQGLLALAQSLYGRSPRALLISVPGTDFELGESLSPAVLQGAGVALHLIGLQVRATTQPQVTSA